MKKIAILFLTTATAGMLLTVSPISAQTPSDPGTTTMSDDTRDDDDTDWGWIGLLGLAGLLGLRGRREPDYVGRTRNPNV